MIGERFGRLVVTLEAGQDKYSSWLYLCKCDCGKDKVAAGWLLRRGDIKSCGCYRAEVLKAKSDSQRTHGARHTRAYYAWINMRNRCDRPNHKFYGDYGARGIKICDAWQKFENFLADMGQPPEGLTLERKENSLGYDKANCVWATKKVQANNRRSSRFIEFNGQRKTLQQWADETGMKRATIAYRIDKGGMTPEQALTTPKLK